MSDLSKCEGKDCPDRDTCRRFTSPADPIWQSYWTPERPGKDCGMYWPTVKESFTVQSPLKIEGSKNT